MLIEILAYVGLGVKSLLVGQPTNKYNYQVGKVTGFGASPLTPHEPRNLNRRE
jgi:hypothetical protein